MEMVVSAEVKEQEAGSKFLKGQDVEVVPGRALGKEVAVV